MSAPVTVVLPVRDQPELTTHVLDRLAAEPRHKVRIVICDNGSGRATKEALKPYEDTCILVNTSGMGLYWMWRFAWRTAAAAARDSGARAWEVAFLNTDIDFLPGTLLQLREAMRDNRLGGICPDYDRRVVQGRDTQRIDRVSGSYRNGGLCGWFFMLPGELETRGVQPDTGFEWWAGDDDLFFQVEAAGEELGICRGLPVDHIGEATARNHPWTQEAKGRDMKRLEAKWGPR